MWCLQYDTHIAFQKVPMTNQFDFTKSTAKYFVSRGGYKIHICARGMGSVHPVHGAVHVNTNVWSLVSMNADGQFIDESSPHAYDIVGEWRDPHPAELWKPGKIIEVSQNSTKWTLRRFVRYDQATGDTICFVDGQTDETYCWKYAREPESVDGDGCN